MNRRHFIKSALLTSAAMLASKNLLAFGSTLTNNPEFKGLIRLNLNGGHDSLNMLVPYEDGPYADYKNIRPLLAIPKEKLIPLNINGYPSGYALHPKLPKLAELFNSGELAFISNVGPLVEPTTKESIEVKQANLPPHLLSHNSQTELWSSCITDRSAPKTGWAGRLADSYLPKDQQFSTGQSIGRKNLWQKGTTQHPYIFGTEGTEVFKGFKAKKSRNTKVVINQLNTFDTRSDSYLIREYNRINTDAMYYSGYVNNVLTSPALEFSPGEFDSSTLGEHGALMDKFKMLAKIILSKDKFARNRATYDISTGGYDTHSGQAASIDRLYAALDNSVYEFYQKMKQHGLEKNITLFCSSEFGRTVTTNDSGTGHGWGGHYFVLGGAVDGGKIYGKQPDLKPGSKDIVLRTRLLPSISVEQYAATMTSWLGLTESQNLELFPNLKNFEQTNLGFMKVK